MPLISSVFLSILVNESPSSIFSHSWGIRLGDSLSPFLFILMAERLGQNIIMKVASFCITGLFLHMHSPTCLHGPYALTKLHNGTLIKQLLKNWCLEYEYYVLTIMILMIMALIPSHVRCIIIQVVDSLANAKVPLED